MESPSVSMRAPNEGVTNAELKVDRALFHDFFDVHFLNFSLNPLIQYFVSASLKYP